MRKFSRRRDQRPAVGTAYETRPVWGHPARHEDDWPARRNRELVQLLSLTSNR